MSATTAWSHDSDGKSLPNEKRYLFELTEQNRSKDTWLNEVLAQDRLGAESFTIYCFSHGFPTTKVGTWMPDTGIPSCGNAACRRLQEGEWAEDFKAGLPWATRQRKECSLCSRERDRRCIVLGNGGKSDVAATMEKFVEAPYIHPYNQPRYHAQICRAVNLAKATGQKVLYCLAEDWPLTAAEENLGMEQIGQMQQKWLERHDRDTAGIMGILPLVMHCVYRLSDHKDIEGGAMKNSRARLVGWELDATEEARIRDLEENEIQLLVQPTALHLEVFTANKKFRSVLGSNILRLKPEKKVWSRDGASKAPVSRKGFQIVPDFGGTAHAYCGESLDAAIGDLLEWHHKPNFARSSGRAFPV